MAIKRCPYCKAIIDEEDKYCNNCGTQLLFPEDESIEEEIPGDRIVDEDEEESGEKELEEIEEHETLEEAEEEEAEEESEAEKEEEVLTGEDEDLGDEQEEEGEEEEQAEKEEEELEFQAGEAEFPVEEAEEEIKEEWGEKIRPLDLEFKEEGKIDEEEEEIAAEAEAAEWEIEKIPAEQPAGEEARHRRDERQEFKEILIEKEKEKEKKYEVAIEEDELVFRTKDLDGLTATVEEGAKELESFFRAFKEGEEKKKRTPASVEESAAVSLDEERPTGTTDVLPPWASSIKESSGVSVSEEKAAQPKIEDSSGLREWTTDSGIGIPEKITQKTLPFADTAAQPSEGEAMKDESLISTEEARPSAGLSLQIKARLIDIVIITALWLISLFFTARVIGVSFSRLVFGSPIPVLAFYLILLLLYFFLFLYFLGETLGDHYFLAEEEDLRREE